MVSSQSAKEALERFFTALEESEQPIISISSLLPSPEEAETLFGTTKFDAIALREPFRRGIDVSPDVFNTLAEQASALLETGGIFALLASPPVLGERISRILHEGSKTELLTVLENAEAEFFSDPSAPWSWTGEMLEKALINRGFTVETTILEREEERLITEKDLALWFDKEKSTWGRSIEKALGRDFIKLREQFLTLIRQGPVLWRWKSLLFKGK